MDSSVYYAGKEDGLLRPGGGRSSGTSRSGKVYQRLRQSSNIRPVYKMIDTCASEFDSYIPYFYSTYETENESDRFRPKRRSSSSAPAPSASVRAWNSTIPPSTPSSTIQQTRLRGHHHQQQPRNRLHRLHHRRQAVLRAADRGGRDEHRASGEARAASSPPWAARRPSTWPQPLTGPGREHHRHRLRRHRKGRKPGRL